jgi:hypothetical protein
LKEDILDFTTTGETKSVEFTTGTLTLDVEKGPPIGDLCDFAQRANPKRGS